MKQLMAQIEAAERRVTALELELAKAKAEARMLRDRLGADYLLDRSREQRRRYCDSHVEWKAVR